MSTITDRVKTTLRELKFPPLQGGPKKDDIIELLEAVLDYDDPEESETIRELRDDIEDLYNGINQAIDDLESLKDISELDGIIEDLRRL